MRRYKKGKEKAKQADQKVRCNMKNKNNTKPQIKLFVQLKKPHLKVTTKIKERKKGKRRERGIDHPKANFLVAEMLRNGEEGFKRK